MTEKIVSTTDAGRDNIKVIYLAGGCFWGMEKLFRAIPGVTETTVGYANGSCESAPTYEQVCRGNTGFKEAMRLSYDASIISLDLLLTVYFLVIDPTLYEQQGNDRGPQYQTGIYYGDDPSKLTVERVVAMEASRHPVFMVEHGPLMNFYRAEEYHQDYLETHPFGYCHIPQLEIANVVAFVESELSYTRPPTEQLRSTLTAEQFNVTQNAATEHPFTGAYEGNHEQGIYVDVTTGQPLFISFDKYESNCGWPSFSRPISYANIDFVPDSTHGIMRTEVKSTLGDAHLGHVFENDPESPTGTRYCINSASLRFIPRDEMKAQGYAPYLLLFDRF